MDFSTYFRQLNKKRPADFYLSAGIFMVYVLSTVMLLTIPTLKWNSKVLSSLTIISSTTVLKTWASNSVVGVIPSMNSRISSSLLLFSIPHWLWAFYRFQVNIPNFYSCWGVFLRYVIPYCCKMHFRVSLKNHFCP